jgi:hypothetical protein
MSKGAPAAEPYPEDEKVNAFPLSEHIGANAKVGMKEEASATKLLEVEPSLEEPAMPDMGKGKGKEVERHKEEVEQKVEVPAPPTEEEEEHVEETKAPVVNGTAMEESRPEMTEERVENFEEKQEVEALKEQEEEVLTKEEDTEAVTAA